VSEDVRLPLENAVRREFHQLIADAGRSVVDDDLAAVRLRDGFDRDEFSEVATVEAPLNEEHRNADKASLVLATSKSEAFSTVPPRALMAAIASSYEVMPRVVASSSARSTLLPCVATALPASSTTLTSVFLAMRDDSFRFRFDVWGGSGASRSVAHPGDVRYPLPPVDRSGPKVHPNGLGTDRGTVGQGWALYVSNNGPDARIVTGVSVGWGHTVRRGNVIEHREQQGKIGGPVPAVTR
jgi:hypothetical protein